MRLLRRAPFRVLACSFATWAIAACSPPSSRPDVVGDAADDASDASGADGADVIDNSPVSVRMELSLTQGFFTAPFPGEHRRHGDGTVDLTGYPNPRRNDYAQSLIALAEQRDGFGLTSAVYFQLTGAPRTEGLPDVAGSVQPNATVFLVSVESGSNAAQRIPVHVSFQSDAGFYGARNLLAIRPVQGFVLRPETLYAAVVLKSVEDTRGRPLEASPTLTQLLEGQSPAALSAGALDAFRRGIDALRTQGVSLSSIAGLTVFRTGNPTRDMQRFRDHALAQPLPTPLEAFRRTDTFDSYCVYESVVEMPVYQRGEPPYATTGGDWAVDARGVPMVQRRERSRVVVTVPRRAMPTNGYPIVIFSRTGGGGDRPLVDRGVQAMTGGPAITPGTGPAFEFARAGWAGISPDGPHGGLRNINHSDEQLLIFNFQNLAAMRDNLRQSALELSLTANVLPSLRINTSDCAGAAAESRFDTSALTIMGHSMGASIAPIAAAFEPRIRAMLLSGAGASWTENVIFKQHPLTVRPLADVLVGYAGTGRQLRTDDPILNILQWAGETADAQVFNRYIIDEPPDMRPRHVLMMQGIVDHYILPSIANAGSLSLGLDFGGTPIDSTTPEIASFTPIAPLLALNGRSVLSLPATANRSVRGAMITAILTQTREDGVEDGHEVVFQTVAPRRQYRCFLESLARATPSVPGAGALDAACE